MAEGGTSDSKRWGPLLYCTYKRPDCTSVGKISLMLALQGLLVSEYVATGSTVLWIRAGDKLWYRVRRE